MTISRNEAEDLRQLLNEYLSDSPPVAARPTPAPTLVPTAATPLPAAAAPVSPDGL